jgi:hypothetical protein
MKTPQERLREKLKIYPKAVQLLEEHQARQKAASEKLKAEKKDDK